MLVVTPEAQLVSTDAHRETSVPPGAHLPNYVPSQYVFVNH